MTDIVPTKKRARSLQQEDGLPAAIKKMPLMPVDLELTINDLLSQTEINELQAAYRTSKTRIRDEAIQCASRYWQQYTNYRKLALETPEVLISMSPEQQFEHFLGHDERCNNRDEFRSVAHLILQRLVYHLARILSVKHVGIQVLVYRATQADVQQSLCTIEELVDSCIYTCCTASAFEAAWAAQTFANKCREFVKGGGKYNWCKGLVQFLRRHLTWQTIPECKEWIDSLELIIQKQQAASAPFPSDSILVRLRQAFEIKDHNSKTMDVIETNKELLNAGRWIRLE